MFGSIHSFPSGQKRTWYPFLFWSGRNLARSERFELPTLGFEVRCSIQLSYERITSYIFEITSIFELCLADFVPSHVACVAKNSPLVSTAVIDCRRLHSTRTRHIEIGR